MEAETGAALARADGLLPSLVTGERAPGAADTREDHDEALTLTTAFVARGATDAVGSRWTTRDGSSALLMAVFHHGLVAESPAPADVPRAAQLWMLDAGRQAPPGLRGELLREVGDPALTRVARWGAFIRQGSPRPFTPPEETP